MPWPKSKAKSRSSKAQSSASSDVMIIPEPRDGEQAPSVPLNPARAVTPAVRGAAEWAWRFIVVVAASGIAIYGLMYLSLVVVPILVAGLLSSLLHPLTVWLRDRAKFPNVLAVISTMVIALGVIGGLLTLAGNAFVDGFPDLRDRAIAGFEDALGWFSNGPLAVDQSTIDDLLDQVQSQVSANANAILSGAWSFTSSAGQIFAGALIALFCLFFFLKEGRTIWMWLVRLFPKVARERVDGAALRSWISLGTYARTQIIVAFVDGIGIGLGAYLLGVPLAIPIGVLVFIASFIPIVGALVSGTVAVAVALVDQGFWIAVAMLAVVLVVQQVEGNLLQPLLMSRALKLHPVAVLLAVTAGATLGGIVGALFAVPVVAVANTAFKYLNGRDDAPEELQGRFAGMTARWRTN